MLCAYIYIITHVRVCAHMTTYNISIHQYKHTAKHPVPSIPSFKHLTTNNHSAPWCRTIVDRGEVWCSTWDLSVSLHGGSKAALSWSRWIIAAVILSYPNSLWADWCTASPHLQPLLSPRAGPGWRAPLLEHRPAFRVSGLDRMAKWVERPSPVLGDREDRTHSWCGA